MIVVTDSRTTTVEADGDGCTIETQGSVVTPALGIDATGTAPGREFLIKGLLQSTAGPAMNFGDATLADSQTEITIDSAGQLLSGGVGLVAFSGGVTFSVKGDTNGAGLVETTGAALDFRQGGNTIKNDGTIRSTGDDAIRSAGALDSIENNGTLHGDRHGVVSDGEDMEIANNGELSAASGYGILSRADGIAVTNAGTISGGLDGVALQADGGSVTNFGTITSKKAAGVASDGADTVITNTTTIEGKTFGIRATGAGAHIINEGTVESVGTGIQALGDHSVVTTSAQLTGTIALALGGKDSIATNTHEIHGTSKVIAAVKLSGTADFINNGSVFATSGHVIAAAGTGSNHVENTGSLHGNVKLGKGNDWFSSLVGEVDGKVDGGKGNDVYEVGIKLRIVEDPGEGRDTVKAMFSWTLGANLENLVLIGDEKATATGNKLANILTGNSAKNDLWGLGGRDIFVMQTDGNTDRIMDFQDGIDHIDFRRVDGIDGFSDFKGHMHQSGHNVIIDLADEDAGMSLVIRKVDLHDLTKADFLF